MRQVNINALRAITKHNITKKLKTNEYDSKIQKILNKMTIDELKTKGVSNIIIEKLKVKQQVITGEGKRKRELESFTEDKRTLLSKTMGVMIGNSFNDVKHNQNKRIDYIKKLISQKQEAEDEIAELKKELIKTEEYKRSIDARIIDEIAILNSGHNNASIIHELKTNMLYYEKQLIEQKEMGKTN